MKTREIPKLIVFDVDDVMFNLNERVAEMKNIAHDKFTQFSIRDNPNMTEDERKRVLAAYTETATYSNITFIQPVIDLVNRIYHKYPCYPVHIISNNATKEIRDVKMEQLLNVLDLPENQIHLNIVNMGSESLQKKLPANMFIFVDDSPHNIAMADAVHKIMPARRHNDVLINGCLNGDKVDRPLTTDQLVETVMTYIKKGGMTT